MELCSLHPFKEETVRDFVITISEGQNSSAKGGWIKTGTEGLALMKSGEDRGAFALTYALGSYLSELQPSFAYGGLSLSTWEARIDRGTGMLLRPPSRLLIDSGLDPVLARQLPIRLEMSRGMMGGAYVPARLVSQFHNLLESKLERTVRRLNDAEWDGVVVLGLMLELTDYCRMNGLAIYEAIDVVSPDGHSSSAKSAQVITADKKRLDKALRTRLETAAKPPKKPGFFARIRRGNDQSESVNSNE